MKVLGIIPARGGSKGISRKNIRLLKGKPLIYYAIASAKASNILDKIIVSTDDDEIARVSQGYDAEVIMRPHEFARDNSPTEDALIHVLGVLKERSSYNPDIILTLEPTSPFRTADLIGRCINIFKTTAADSVIGVVETRSCYGKVVKGRFEFLFPGQPRRRQDREPLYRESSTIYAVRIETLIRKKSVLGDNLYPVIVSEVEAIDINTEIDFCIAEAMINFIS